MVMKWINTTCVYMMLGEIMLVLRVAWCLNLSM